MKFAEYLRMVSKRYGKEVSWRMGQTYFNVLREINPHLAAEICGKAFDPFHNDLYIPAFLGFVCSVWEDWQEDFITEDGDLAEYAERNLGMECNDYRELWLSLWRGGND